MIVGSGQLAQVFMENDKGDSVIFASGVPNSNCTDSRAFERERDLLLETLKNSSDKKFVYFSSCALSAPEYQKNAYYKHKENMEILIKEYSNNYYIFRIPQLFGKLKHHKTLINFLYESILCDREFKVYSEAYRYVIEIEDVKKLVESFLQNSCPNTVIDLANPYRYKVLELVAVLENILNKKAKYTIVNKKDSYLLELSELEIFIQKQNIEIDFGKNYFFKKIAEKI